MHMSKTGRPIGFDLEEMLELRRQGWSYSALGFKYGRDHSTMVRHCLKAGVEPIIPIRRRPSVPEVIPWVPKAKEPIVDKYAYVFDTPIHAGRSYESYLAEAMQRPTERAYMEMYRMV